jgi:hypothetical protein
MIGASRRQAQKRSLQGEILWDGLIDRLFFSKESRLCRSKDMGVDGLTNSTMIFTDDSLGNAIVAPPEGRPRKLRAEPGSRCNLGSELEPQENFRGVVQLAPETLLSVYKLLSLSSTRTIMSPHRKRADDTCDGRVWMQSRRVLLDGCFCLSDVKYFWVLRQVGIALGRCTANRMTSLPMWGSWKSVHRILLGS